MARKAPSRVDLSEYKGSPWASIRARQLSAQPLCAGCLSEGIVNSANTVDHVFPWRKLGNHAFLHNRFQSLCAAHHSLKTGLEQKGIIRAYGDRDYGLGDYGFAMSGLTDSMESTDLTGSN